MFFDKLRLEQLPMPRESAETHVSTITGVIDQLLQVADVDQHLRSREAQVERCEQALAARERDRVAIAVGKDAIGLPQRCWPNIAEVACLHGAKLSEPSSGYPPNQPKTDPPSTMMTSPLM